MDRTQGGQIKDLLLIQSFSLDELIVEYRLFFLSILPSAFLLAVLIEFFGQIEPFSLVKRAVVSIILLASVNVFYTQTIALSIDAADKILRDQKNANIFLMDFFGGVKHIKTLKDQREQKSFFQEGSVLSNIFSFLRHHLFTSFVNNVFTVSVFFIITLCLLILKIVYSLVYYMGYGLIGIPCVLFLFPSMENVLKGGLLGYIWCLILPHVLVIVLSMIGAEINKSYVSGEIVGGSLQGTALLFIMSLSVAFVPMVTAAIISGTGIAYVAGTAAAYGSSFIVSMPKTVVKNAGTLTGMRTTTLGRAKNFFKASTGNKEQTTKKKQKSFSPSGVSRKTRGERK